MYFHGLWRWRRDDGESVIGVFVYGADGEMA